MRRLLLSTFLIWAPASAFSAEQAPLDTTGIERYPELAKERALVNELVRQIEDDLLYQLWKVQTSKLERDGFTGSNLHDARIPRPAVAPPAAITPDENAELVTLYPYLTDYELKDLARDSFLVLSNYYEKFLGTIEVRRGSSIVRCAKYQMVTFTFVTSYTWSKAKGYQFTLREVRASERTYPSCPQGIVSGGGG